MTTFPIYPFKGGEREIVKWAEGVRNGVQESADDLGTIQSASVVVTSASSAFDNEKVLTGETNIISITPAADEVTISIDANSLGFTKIAQIATSRILGRVTAATGDIESLTGTQATTLLDAMGGDSGSGGLKGLVPAQAIGDAGKYLDGDGTFKSLPQAAVQSDAAASTVDVTSTDAGATYTAAERALINELKADVNSLVSDVNDIVTVVNDLIDKLQAADLMGT